MQGRREVMYRYIVYTCEGREIRFLADEATFPSSPYTIFLQGGEEVARFITGGIIGWTKEKLES